MNASTGSNKAPAGWYQDAHDPSQFRWWDGNGWTEARVVVPPVEPPPDPKSEAKRIVVKPYYSVRWVLLRIVYVIGAVAIVGWLTSQR